MADAREKNRDDKEVPLEKKLDDLYALIDGIEIAMLTTRRPNGELVSRAMDTQKRTAGADIWFMTNADAQKLEDIAGDQHVNLSYYRDRTREWVSVSGRATIVRDRKVIRDLYKADWRAWLGDEGGQRDGGPDDPRIALIFVEAQSVVYSKNDRPAPLVLFEIAKAMATGEPPKVANLRELDAGALDRARETGAAGVV
jgi:general stress protein 26